MKIYKLCMWRFVLSMVFQDATLIWSFRLIQYDVFKLWACLLYFNFIFTGMIVDRVLKLVYLKFLQQWVTKALPKCECKR